MASPAGNQGFGLNASEADKEIKFKLENGEEAVMKRVRSQLRRLPAVQIHQTLMS
ncbi:hypothetical protein PO124_13600 [Bacillus licheniformis]|nr:hypothetical protein [Bacillus licheniformis]